MTKSVSSFVLGLCFVMSPVLSWAQTTKFIDPANMDLSVKPGDNFYQYANGTWIKTHPSRVLKPVGAVLMHWPRRVPKH